MGEKERLNTAIHESGHAITGYFNKDAMELYKATIVARGGALGVVSTRTNFNKNFQTFFVPNESFETSSNKAQMLAQIDVAMGGHVAEKLIIGNEKITSGCSNDLQNATQLATRAVRQYGMFGDLISYNSTK